MEKRFFIFFFIISNYVLFGQEGQINGDFNLSLQSYQEDILIDAQAADEIVLSNAYLNLNYTKGNFRTGIRYESYLNALADFDPEFKGNGIPFKYATYKLYDLEITAGNFYEQFGTGLIFRSYEEKGLGIDNAMDGVRLKYDGLKATNIKGFIGKSRTHFTYADGIFRGIDGEVNINELFNSNIKTQFSIGGSFVSRYQERSNIVFKIPQNVGAYATRLNVNNGGWNSYTEFAYKVNDPANVLTESQMNYASGSAFLTNLNYSKKGFGISAALHRIDNMTFKSDRDRDGKAYLINYVPTLSKPHTYSLLTLYPYAIQLDGEIGVQLDLFLNIKKGTFLGGKYGTKLNFNMSRMNGMSGNYGSSFLNDQVNYTPMILCFAQELFFQDINLEVNKKINKKTRSTFVLANQIYNKDFLEGKTKGENGMISSSIIVADITYKIKKGHTIRMELQNLFSQQLKEAEKLAEGDWSMGLIEYTVSPNWFFTVQDMYNWGHEDSKKRLHYLNLNVGYSKKSNRFEIGYGKKREGIFCVGGICKLVPSSNGFNISVSSSF